MGAGDSMETRLSERRSRDVGPRVSVVDLPRGTVTFLMTDVEGSTKAWESVPHRVVKQVLMRHHRILEEQVEKNQGRMVEAGREGDSVLAVFRQASDAVACALEMQRALGREQWPAGVGMAVRVAIHTGEAELDRAHYVGAVVSRCQRIMATGFGGQILVSGTTEEIVADALPDGSALVDLGHHRLRDFSRPVQLFQLTHPDLRASFPPLKSLEPEKTNLPEPLTSFVGRRADLTALMKAVRTSRMLTLLGAGGIGKSRLAMEIARRVLDNWPDGVWWIDLTPLDDAQLVAATVATELQLSTKGSPTARVLTWFARKRALLVIDNCEHLVSGVADLCEALLKRCPDISIVATSRVPLHVEGEARWPVGSLDDADALELFEVRGKLVDPNFEINERNRNQVSGICNRLDDLPLAIELAASKLGILSEHEIGVQLADRLDLLSVTRSVDPRHQTMVATLDWSYRLLSDTEATLFRRLAVFRGGFGLDAAQAICADEQVPDLISTLGALVEKSMVVKERLENGESRYRLLDSQTVFAEDKLRASEEIDAIHARHYDYYEAAIEARTGGLSGPMRHVVPGAAGLAWKWREIANFWVAMEWARGHRSDGGLPMAAYVGFIEGLQTSRVRRWLLELLDEVPLNVDQRFRLTAYSSACAMANNQGDFSEAYRFARLAVDFVTPRPDRDWRNAKAMALNHLGNALEALGRSDEARAAYEEGLSYAESENKRLRMALRHGLALVSFETGDLDGARRQVVECLNDVDPNVIAPAMIAGLHDSLGNIDLAGGDFASAETHMRVALEILGSRLRPYSQIQMLGCLARLATAKHEHRRALRLGAALRQLSAERELHDYPFWESWTDRSLDESRAALDPKVADACWKQGLAMNLDQATAYALESSAPEPRDAGPLSNREAEVVVLVTEGLKNREIATRLFLSVRTVEGRLDQIRAKLGVRSRSQIAAWATEHGLVTSGR